MKAHKRRIDSENWADHVLCAILTDGEENDSKFYTLPQVRELVAECMRAGWQFVFLGADQDAVLAAAQLGIDDSVDFRNDPEGLSLAYEAITKRVLALGYTA